MGWRDFRDGGDDHLMSKFIYNEDADVWGEPQVYKGINIYPVLVRDRQMLDVGMEYFAIQKTNPDIPETVRMGYLQYLIRFVLAPQAYLCQSQEPFERFLQFLKFICKDCESIGIKHDGVNYYLLFDERRKIYNTGFDKIRSIFFKQNGLSYVEITSPHFAKEIQKAYEILAKRSKHAPTFQEDVVNYHCVTGVLYQDIKNLTWWQFRHGLLRMSIIKQYEIWAAPVATTPTKEKKPDIPSWNSHIEDKPFIESILTDLNTINKIN